MAKQTINLGTGELTGDGESIRSAFSKINDNFDELYTKDSNDVVLSAINGHIIPDTDVAYDIGSATNRFRDLYLSGSTIDLGGTTLSVVGGELQLDGVKIPTQADVAATVASAVAAPSGDLTGSVFADDSTLLVDGVNGLVVGEVDTPYVTTANGIGFGQTGYTMAVDEGGVLYLTGTNGDDDIVIRTNSSGEGQYDWTFGKDGTTTFPGGITFNGTLDFTDASSIQNFAPGNIYANSGQYLYVVGKHAGGSATNVAFIYDAGNNRPRQIFYGKTEFGNNGQAPIVDFTNATVSGFKTNNITSTDNFTINSNNGTGDAPNAGSIYLTAGEGNAADGNGGDVSITAGDGGGLGNGGQISIIAGSGVDGGDVQIDAGTGFGTNGVVKLGTFSNAVEIGDSSYPTQISLSGNVDFTNATVDWAAIVGNAIQNNGLPVLPTQTLDISGSIFADDSTLLVDGVNGKIVAPIDINDNEIFDGAGDTGLNIRSNQTDGNIYLYSYGSDGDGTGAGNIYVTGNGVDIYGDWRNGGVGEYKWSFGGDGTLRLPASSIGGGIGLIYSPTDSSIWLSGTNVDKSTDGNGVVLNGGQNDGTGRGGGISLFGGSSTGGTGGSIFIETGIGQGGADNGVISIGTAYAKTITIGKASQSDNNRFFGNLIGNVENDDDITITVANNDSTTYAWNFGNTGDLTIPGDITFNGERTISPVDTSTSSGSTLTIQGGTSTSSFAMGGNVNIDGGAGQGAGAGGSVLINTGTNGGVLIGKSDGTGFDVQTYSRLHIHRGVVESYETKQDATGVVEHDCDAGHLFYHTSPDANWTVNLTNLNSFSGMSTNIVIVIEQGGTPYYPNALQIDGAAQTIKWLGNATPTPSGNKTEIATFTIFDSGSSYNVLGSYSTYG